MRVPVYQQQVTPQIPSVRTQVQVPDGATGVALNPVDTSAGIAQGVESLRLGLMKMNENREKFMLASAVNEYRRSNTEFLHAKDTGVFAKKGKDVFGISQQYDEFSSKTMEDIAKRYKMSGAARDRFVEATSALYNASLSSVMTHEQRETDAAQQQEWKAMASDTLSNIALCYADDSAFNENVQFGLSAISQQWEPYGDQVRDSKMREYLSQCQVQRVAAMLEESPKAAGAYLEKHKGDFAGDDYLKVKKAVDNKLDVIKVQETTDALVKKFRGSEQAALQYIHKNYEGDMENKLVTAAKARFGEMEIRAHSAATAAAKQYSQMVKACKQGNDAGRWYTAEELAKDNVPQEYITKILAYQEGKRRWAEGVKKVKSQYTPDVWLNMTQDEKDEKTRTYLGITPAMHKQALEQAYEGRMSGNLDADGLKDWSVYGFITPREARGIEDEVKEYNDEQKEYLATQRANMKETLKELGKKYPALNTTEIMGAFRESTRGLKPADAQFRNKVKEAGRDAVVAGIDKAFANGAQRNSFFIFNSALMNERERWQAMTFTVDENPWQKVASALNASATGRQSLRGQPTASASKKEEAKKAFKAALPQAKPKEKKESAQPAPKEG